MDTINQAFLAGWRWASRHGEVEATAAQADALLRGIGLPTDTGHVAAFCSGTIDRSRGDDYRYRLTAVTPLTPAPVTR